MKIISDNPYQLIQDIEGIGFQRADELAKTMGISGKHPERIQAACLFWLNERAMNDGHVFMPLDELTRAAKDLLSTPDETVEEIDIVRELDMLEEEEKNSFRGRRCVFAAALLRGKRDCHGYQKIDLPNGFSRGIF
ncbi:helix-hairpin-helix domain-containing protein [Terrilactibacillus sp. S3-3]|nr:helix-hairpin-helix domain-containing protein [Terrilactibacillus sp. S3-3]